MLVQDASHVSPPRARLDLATPRTQCSSIERTEAAMTCLEDRQLIIAVSWLCKAPPVHAPDGRDGGALTGLEGPFLSLQDFRGTVRYLSSEHTRCSPEGCPKATQNPAPAICHNK